MKNLFILILLALSSTLSYGQKYTAYFFSDDYYKNIDTINFDNEIKSISAGNVPAAIILESDSVIEFRFGNFNEDEGIPRDIRFKSIDYGFTSGIGVSEDNTGYGWDPSGTNWKFADSLDGKINSVASGMNHSIILLKDSTVLAWGSNNYSQSNVPDNLTGVIDIDAGFSFSVALTYNGHVIKWGSLDPDPYDPDPKTDTLFTSPNLKKISAGDGFTGIGEIYGLTKDSLLIKITEEGSEELTELGKVKDFSVGQGYAFVLKEDNTVEVLEQYSYHEMRLHVESIRQLENVQWIAAGDCVAVVITKDEILSNEDHISNGQELSDNLKLIPNPALNTVTIITNSGSVSQLQVLSLDGKAVLETSTFGQEHTLDISSFSSGTYLVQIQNEQGVFHSKLVKQ